MTELAIIQSSHFRRGGVTDLKEKLSSLLEKDLSITERGKIQKQIEEKYNWDRIAEQTIEVYERIVNA